MSTQSPNLNAARNLKIYTASAGSGKTYTLTRKYLYLLLTHPNPYYFRTILAVTFTNKATAEMKNRIIEELDNLSRSDDPKATEVFRSAPEYDSDMTRGSDFSLPKTHEEVKERAAKVLSVMLQNYTDFRVQTIDSFFQEVVRSFAFENALNGAFGIDLDSDEVITASVQSLMNRIGDPEIADFTKWLSGRYLDLFKDQETFNIFKDLQRLAQHILFNEEMETFVHQLTDPSFDSKLTVLQKDLMEKKKDIEQKFYKAFQLFHQFAHDQKLDLSVSPHNYLQIISDYGAPDQLKETRALMLNPNGLGKRFAGYLAKETLVSAGKKKTPEGMAVDANKSAILEHLNTIDNLFSNTVFRRNYITIVLILRHLDILPALSHLVADIQAYCKENNILLISDINKLLKTIIVSSDVDVPFIYDKIGTFINHYMIDEMQDTSPMQWTNFKPLLLDSLHQGNLNLLVGDVKQSIYRFRGTDSSLLAKGIPEDPGVKPFVDSITLPNNWRSFYNIVEFNNRFFREAFNYTAIFDEDTTDISGDIEPYETIYKASPQNVSPKHINPQRGYVTASIFPKQSTSDKAEAGDAPSLTYDHFVQEWLLTKLTELQHDRHFAPHEIAILVRNGVEGAKIADMLAYFDSDPNKVDDLSFNFLSDQALLISNSPMVKLLVCIIRFFAYPSDPQIALELDLHLHRYYDLIGRSQVDSTAIKSGILDVHARGFSVFESIARLLQIIAPDDESQDHKDDPYVNAFLDNIYELSSRQTLTFLSLADWWARNEKSAMINMGETNLGGIRIITIHKAKGLEFPVVLIPYASWALQKPMLTKPIVATLDANAPDYLKTFGHYLIPVSAKLLPHSFFSTATARLDLLDYMDNLNLLYVAFTRAEQELHLCLDAGLRSKNTYHIIRPRLDAMAQENEQPTLSLDENDKGISTFTFGEPVISDTSRIEPSELDKNSLNGLFETPRNDKFVLNPNELGHFPTKDEHRSFGIVMHDILTHTTDLDTFNIGLEKAFKRGLITADQLAEVGQKFSEIITRAPFSEWFGHPSDERPIPRRYHEQSIITPSRVYRPDLVIDSGLGSITVVDFKFGERTAASDSRYKKQVLNYIQLLHNAGFTNVSGYVWYNLEDDYLKI